MTLQEIFRCAKLTPYSAAKKIGIPWETIQSVYAGNLSLYDCEEQLITSLADVLHITRDELLQAKADLSPPSDRSYLEVGLPPYLQHDIDAYIEGEKNNVTHMDCLWGELYGSINSAQWDGVISIETADYLRAKYLFADNEDEE